MIWATSSPIPATHGLRRFVWVRYPRVSSMRKTAAYAGYEAPRQYMEVTLSLCDPSCSPWS